MVRAVLARAGYIIYLLDLVVFSTAELVLKQFHTQKNAKEKASGFSKLKFYTKLVLHFVWCFKWTFVSN